MKFGNASKFLRSDMTEEPNKFVLARNSSSNSQYSGALIQYSYTTYSLLYTLNSYILINAPV